ncbi:MAG: hypothetical protein DRP47_09385 [Candidatus Zixiibacteriota bacterium]|nr:MAG: hypothetical protein DRP47_09385 [candidate division Zixibacteria bacterium]
MSLFNWTKNNFSPGEPDNHTTSDNQKIPDNNESCFNLTQAFSDLTEELSKDYDITKGVLVIRMQDTQNLAAISTWKDGMMRDGLTVTLPSKSSLFEKVAENGCVYTEDFCAAFSGNFFERKLLLDDNSRSFVVQPLKTKGKVVGLVAYSSDQPTAFAMFEEGVVQPVAAKFACEIESLLKQL